jgi:hypothetical protein
MAVLVACPRDAAAQIPDWAAIHRGAVDIYLQTGDLVQASRTRSSRSRSRTSSARSRRWSRRRTPRWMRAVAVFHLEIAAAVAGTSPGNRESAHRSGPRTAREDRRSSKEAGWRVDGLDELRSIWPRSRDPCFSSDQGPATRDPVHTRGPRRRAEVGARVDRARMRKRSMPRDGTPMTGRRCRSESEMCANGLCGWDARSARIARRCVSSPAMPSRRSAWPCAADDRQARLKRAKRSSAD